MTTNVRELMASIRAGEDSELELKEVVFRGDRISLGSADARPAARLAQILVSMANTSGGRIVLGVRDSDRVPVGIDPDKRELVEGLVVNAATQNCVPMIVAKLNWEFLPGEDGDPKLCLIAEVPTSRLEVHQTSDGRYLQRIDSHQRLIPAGRLARLLSSRGLARPVEERPMSNATIDDLDEVRLVKYLRSRFPDWQKSEDPDDWHAKIIAQKAAVEVDGQAFPTHLGILLFTERPDHYLPEAFIDLALYAHDVADGQTADSLRVFGPVPEQIAQALSWLRLSSLNPVLSTKDGDGRRDHPAYSAWALQEAVVNAIVHRDYEVRGSQIIIRMFPDRVEVQNPGALPNSLTVRDLYEGCHPNRRNQVLAGFLRNYKSPVTGSSYMEARGEGFLNLVRASESLSGRRPVLEQIGEATKLTIFAARHEQLGVG